MRLFQERFDHSDGIPSGLAIRQWREYASRVKSLNNGSHGELCLSYFLAMVMRPELLRTHAMMAALCTRQWPVSSASYCQADAFTRRVSSAWASGFDPRTACAPFGSSQSKP
eukprot:TRINITY_DN99_c0_g2_i2.p1 TRINITY_DN99_c0_g2~~TRINITY_DN99_c0_g2_i2.p1  ORF type:complete len:112 (-),score=1.96 TRINITY_DN99_c0_g2_i2:290-625(-)